MLYNPFNSERESGRKGVGQRGRGTEEEKERKGEREHAHPSCIYQAAGSFLFLQNQHPFVIQRNVRPMDKDNGVGIISGSWGWMGQERATGEKWGQL